MDRFSEKQERINHRRIEASVLYPALWSSMIAEWASPGLEDRVWLTYSANYLFRTNNIRWAFDPLTLNWRIKESQKVDVAQDLSGLSFALLTHAHKDHLDIDLLSDLRHTAITWVVPNFILSKVISQAGLSHEHIIVPTPLVPIELSGFHILPFDDLHWEAAPDGKLKGIPAMGYLIEFNGKRWLFPGDTRIYHASRLPLLGPVDVLFAHLWLGRGSALMDEPPLLDAFCSFCLDLKPNLVILTHLNEFGRDANDFWDESHVQCVALKIKEINPSISVIPAYMGENISL